MPQIHACLGRCTHPHRPIYGRFFQRFFRRVHSPRCFFLIQELQRHFSCSYDGHGGPQVAALVRASTFTRLDPLQHCALTSVHASLRLHVYLAEELRSQKTVRDAFAAAYERVDIDARNQVPLSVL